MNWNNKLCDGVSNLSKEAFTNSHVHYLTLHITSNLCKFIRPCRDLIREGQTPHQNQRHPKRRIQKRRGDLLSGTSGKMGPTVFTIGVLWVLTRPPISRWTPERSSRYRRRRKLEVSGSLPPADLPPPPLIFSVDKIIGAEAESALKYPAIRFTNNWCKPYSWTCS